MRKIQITLLMIVATLTASGQAAAQCRDLLQSHIDFLAPGGSRAVSYKMTTNRADSRYVSYTEGTFKPKLDSSSRPIGLTDAARNGATQYFSDRRYTHAEVSRCTFYSGLFGKPFNVLKPDNLLVEVTLNPSDASGRTVNVSTTLLSWGRGQQNFTGECRNGLLFGFVDNIMFTLSFADTP